MKNEENKKLFALPRVDYCFKKIFGDEKNQSILIDFLCSILKLEKSQIEIIEIKNSEITKENITDPASRMDLLVRINKEETIDIEIQLQIHAALPGRMVKYWAQNFVTTLEISMQNTQLKPCITIWILNEYLYKEIDKAHLIFEIIERNTGIKLSDLLEIHIIELPKIDNEQYTTIEDDKLLEWLRFLKLESEEEAEKMKANVANQEVGTAIDMLKIFSFDEKSRLEYLNRISALNDYNTEIFEAKREGIEIGEKKGIAIGEKKGIEIGEKKGIEIGEKKGIEIGEKKATIEVKEANARNLLDVLDVETIASKIGLPIERVKELKAE